LVGKRLFSLDQLWLYLELHCINIYPKVTRYTWSMIVRAWCNQGKVLCRYLTLNCVSIDLDYRCWIKRTPVEVFIPIPLKINFDTPMVWILRLLHQSFIQSLSLVHIIVTYSLNMPILITLALKWESYYFTTLGLKPESHSIFTHVIKTHFCITLLPNWKTIITSEALLFKNIASQMITISDFLHAVIGTFDILTAYLLALLTRDTNFLPYTLIWALI
jgi:hypothetical protein